MASMKRSAWVFLVLATVSGTTAEADIILFSGGDPGVGPGGARPNSNAAAASFDAAAGALGTTSLVTFESAPVGNFNSLSIAPGVTATLSGTDPSGANVPGIANDPGNATLGYNTTVGGSRYLRVVPDFSISTASVAFAFDAPIQAFGAYFTGLGTAAGALHVVFNDGSSRDLSVTGSGDGGVQFFGFTDAGASIASVTLQLTGVQTSSRDIFALDDLRFTPAGRVVPEPASLALAGMGLLAALSAAHGRRAP